jgi:2'-5' RNA ligase
MTRLFTAIGLPDETATEIAAIQSGVPGARWQSRAQLHLTLRFLGEVDGHKADAIDDVLAAIAAPKFTLQLHGVGMFGNDAPDALWAGLRPNEGLLHLQRKIDGAVRRLGLAADTRKYTPHVTLARLRGADKGRVLDYLTDHALFTSAAFAVPAFILYSSERTSDGSVYRAEKAYWLKDGP